MEFKLIIKKINNTLTKEEQEVFDAWYNESVAHRLYYNKAKEHYLKGLDILHIKKAWNEVSLKVTAKNNTNFYLKYAAAFVFFVTLGFLWFLNTETNQVKTVVKQVKEVEPNSIKIGTDKATLTLADGSQVVLEKGATYQTEKVSSNGERLVYNSGEKSKTNIPAENVLTIPRGGQFFLVLADGTKVWLNSETQLKYPVSFLKNEPRKVTLIYGEAYFEVSPSTAHDETHFIVQSEQQQIDVLGTEFNIKAYKEDDIIATTLVEGKVLVKNESDTQNLTPGHQAKWSRKTNSLKLSKVNVYDIVSWKNGLFSFKNQSLATIMKVLSRWYDIDVVFTNENIKKLTFNGVLRKTLSLHQILHIIKNTNEVNYEIKNNTIIMY